MAFHELPLEQRTLHGHFSRDLEPVLTVEPGDSVRISVPNAGWYLESGYRPAARVAARAHGRRLARLRIRRAPRTCGADRRDGMLDLIVREHGLGRDDALAFASVVVDLRVTQVVTGVLGVNAVLRDDAIS